MSLSFAYDVSKAFISLIIVFAILFEIPDLLPRLRAVTDSLFSIIWL